MFIPCCPEITTPFRSAIFFKIDERSMILLWKGVKCFCCDEGCRTGGRRAGDAVYGRARAGSEYYAQIFHIYIVVTHKVDFPKMIVQRVFDFTYLPFSISVYYLLHDQYDFFGRALAGDEFFGWVPSFKSRFPS